MNQKVESQWTEEQLATGVDKDLERDFPAKRDASPLGDVIINLPAVQPANELERHIAIVRRTAEAAEQASVEIDAKAKADLKHIKANRASAIEAHKVMIASFDNMASMVRARAAEDIATKDRIAAACRAALKVLE